MSTVYAVISVVALILASICCVVDKRKDIWLRLLFIAVFVCDLGYFLVSVAKSLSGALMANRVVFLGSVFLPFFMLMMILRLCNASYPKKLVSALVVLGIAAFVSASIPGIRGLYYINITFERVDGVSRLVREYGPCYIGYVLYYVVYSISMLVVIIRSAKAKRLVEPNHAGFLLSTVLINVVVWIVEKFVPSGFEILTVTYLMTELFILFLYLILLRYGVFDSKPPADAASEVREPEPVLAFVPASVPAPSAQRPEQEHEHPHEGRDDGLLFSPEWVERVVGTREELSCLSEREKEVLKHILANKKRKEIAETLVVSESTIKKHTSQIYKKLGVTNRIGLFVKIKSLE